MQGPGFESRPPPKKKVLGLRVLKDENPPKRAKTVDLNNHTQLEDNLLKVTHEIYSRQPNHWNLQAFYEVWLFYLENNILRFMYWKSDFDPAQHSAYDEEERQPSGFVILFYRKPTLSIRPALICLQLIANL